MTGHAGRDGSEAGRRYSAADEDHERQYDTADSSNDADASSHHSSDGHLDDRLENSVGGSRWSSSQQQFWAVTTDTTATTAASEHEQPFRSKQDIRSREFK